jgi:hypothetical protein
MTLRHVVLVAALFVAAWLGQFFLRLLRHRLPGPGAVVLGSGAVHRVEERRAGIVAWLDTAHPEVFSEQLHVREGTSERAYWHHGYAMALADLLVARAGEPFGLLPPFAPGEQLMPHILHLLAAGCGADARRFLESPTAAQELRIVVEVLVERGRQLGKGRVPEGDDARTASDWLACLKLVTDEGLGGDDADRWRRFMVKLGAIGVAGTASTDRKLRALGDEGPAAWEMGDA